MKNALVVEDSKSEQKLVQALLEKMKLHVDIANNGFEALDWLKGNAQPDIIF